MKDIYEVLRKKQGQLAQLGKQKSKRCSRRRNSCAVWRICSILKRKEGMPATAGRG